MIPSHHIKSACYNFICRLQWAAVDMCLTKGDEMRPGFYKEVRTPSPPPSYHAQLGVPAPTPRGAHAKSAAQGS